MPHQKQVWVPNCQEKISDCVNSVVDFFNFVTEASVCMIACELLNIDDIDEIADALPADEVDRYTFLASLSEKVVSWHYPK